MKLLRTVISVVLIICTLFLSSCNGKDATDENPENATDTGEGITSPIPEKNIFDGISVLFLLSADKTAEGFCAELQKKNLDSLFSETDYASLTEEKKYNINTEDFYSARAAADEAIKNGSNIIFASGSSFSLLTEELAEEYPDITFFCCDGTESNGTNLFYYSAKIYEAFYLAGVAAGLESRTNRIAFVAEKDTQPALVFSSANAFCLGAKAVKPDISVYFKSADNEGTTQSAIMKLSSAGCDIFAGNFAEEETYNTFKLIGRKAFSFGEKNMPVCNENIIGNIYTDFSDFFRKTINYIADGNSEEIKNYYSGISDDTVGLSLYTNTLTNKNTVLFVNKITELIEKKNYKIFSGYKVSFNSDGEIEIYEDKLISDNGDIILSEGGYALGDAEIRNTMNFFTEGITVR